MADAIGRAVAIGRTRAPGRAAAPGRACKSNLFAWCGDGRSDGDSALGEDFAEAISTANAWVDTEKLAQILPTLPRNDMEIFDIEICGTICR